MALKAIISADEHSALGEGLQAEYKLIPAEGATSEHYRLDVTPSNGWGLEDAQGLKTVLQEAKDGRAEARAELKILRDKVGNDDLDKLRTQAKKAQEMDNWSPEEKVREQIALETGKLRDDFEKKSTGWKDREEGLLGAIRDSLVRSQALQALQRHKGNADLLLPIITSRVKLEEQSHEDGRIAFVAKVLGDNGVALPTQESGKTDPMSVDEFVGSVLRTDTRYSPAFAGSGQTGSGAQTSEGGGVSGGVHRISFQDSIDPVKYEAAREAARVSGKELQVVGSAPWDGANPSDT